MQLRLNNTAMSLESGKTPNGGAAGLVCNAERHAAHEGPLEGKTVRIDDVLNVEVLIITFRLKESKYQNTSAPDFLTIQFEYPDRPGEKHVIFTGSNVLVDQLQKYKEQLPFLTTIKKVDRYFTLS